MVYCLFCENKITKYKSNSHVLPLWCSRTTLDKNGRNRSLDLEEFKDDKNNQKSIKGDFICDKCEKIFADLDTYASKTFRIKSIKESKKIFWNEDFQGGFEWQNVDNKKILKFIWSVVVRQYIYDKIVLKKNNSVLTEKQFQDMKEEINSDNPLNKFEVSLIRTFEQKASLPQVFTQEDKVKAVVYMSGDFIVHVWTEFDKNDGESDLCIPLSGLIKVLDRETKEQHIEFIKKHEDYIFKDTDPNNKVYFTCRKCRRKLKQRKKYGYCYKCHPKRLN